MRRGSAPTQNCPSWPVITAPLTALSPAMRSTNPSSSSMVTSSMAGSWPSGALSVITAAPSRSTVQFKSRSVMNGLSVGVAGSVGIAFPDVVGDEHQVEVRIMAAFARRPRPDHQEGGIPVGPIDQMMAVRHPGGKRRRIARHHPRLAIRFDKHEFAVEHVDELVLRLVPVALRRCGTRLEPNQLDAELRQAAGIAERLGMAAPHQVAERRRIAR